MNDRDITNERILIQNILNRATDVAIAKYGKDITIDNIKKTYKVLKAFVDQEMTNIGK